MKGVITLKVNEATMIEAYQKLVDHEYKHPAPKVTEVKHLKDGLLDFYTVTIIPADGPEAA